MNIHESIWYLPMRRKSAEEGRLVQESAKNYWRFELRDTVPGMRHDDVEVHAIVEGIQWCNEERCPRQSRNARCTVVVRNRRSMPRSMEESWRHCSACASIARNLWSTKDQYRKRGRSLARNRPLVGSDASTSEHLSLQINLISSTEGNPHQRCLTLSHNLISSVSTLGWNEATIITI